MVTIEESKINKEEGNMEIRLVPMHGAFLIQITSDILRGTFVMDHSLDKDDLNEISDRIFQLIDEVSMRSFSNEDEIGH